jgi:GT2 family glycosyltransferase
MKVAICVPTRGEPKAGFHFDYVSLHAYTKAALPDCELIFVQDSGSVLPDLRIRIAKEALAKGADWLFWLDDDMRFPPDALVRLLAHRRDIVGVNYVTKTIPPFPTTRRFLGDGKWTAVKTTEKSAGLEEVTGVGFGCVLVNARVFKKMEQPWFSMPWSPVNDQHIGEDLYFCGKAAMHDSPTYVDHDLSKEVRHIGSFEFGWDHFDAIQEVKNEDPR